MESSVLAIWEYADRPLDLQKVMRSAMTAAHDPSSSSSAARNGIATVHRLIVEGGPAMPLDGLSQGSGEPHLVAPLRRTLATMIDAYRPQTASIM